MFDFLLKFISKIKSILTVEALCKIESLFNFNIKNLNIILGSKHKGTYNSKKDPSKNYYIFDNFLINVILTTILSILLSIIIIFLVEIILRDNNVLFQFFNLKFINSKKHIIHIIIFLIIFLSSFYYKIIKKERKYFYNIFSILLIIIALLFAIIYIVRGFLL